MPEALRGDLAWVSVGGLLQLAETEACSGVMQLPGDASVTLAHGRPVEARCGALSGWQALLQVLLARSGAFRLELGAPPAGATPIAEVSTAVLEGCRLADELDRLGPMRLGAKGARPADGAAGRLFDAADGDRTVVELIAAAGLPEVVAVDQLLSLLDQGTLVEAAPADPARARAARASATPAPAAAGAPSVPAPAPAAPPAPESVDADTLVERARDAFRARDLERAATLFRSALALRPNDRVVSQNLHRVESLLRESR